MYLRLLIRTVESQNHYKSVDISFTLFIKYLFFKFNQKYFKQLIFLVS